MKVKKPLKMSKNAKKCSKLPFLAEFSDFWPLDGKFEVGFGDDSAEKH